MKTLGVILLVVGLAEHRLGLAALGGAIWYLTPDAGAASSPTAQAPLFDQNQYQPIAPPARFSVTPSMSIATLGNSQLGG